MAHATQAGIAQRILDHLLAVLQNATVHTRPFAHFSIEQAFPQDVYAELLERMPAPGVYFPDNPKRFPRPDGSSSRSLLGLDEANLNRLPAPDRPLWAGVAEALGSPLLKARIFEMLGSDLRLRFLTQRHKVANIPANPRPTLVRDIGSFSIEPHPDTRAKIVTTGFYLARDRSQIQLGTALYRLRLFDWRNLITTRSPLKKFKQFEFRPNTGFAFAVGHTSWHGVDPVPESAGVRNTLLNFYYRKPQRA